MASEEIRADLLLGRDTLSPGLIKAGEAASHTSTDVKQLTRDLYELGKQRATPIVDLNDKDADARLSGFVAKLKELSAKVADPGVDLNDKDAVAKLAAYRVQLANLAKKVASPRITLEGLAKDEAKLLALDAQLDKLDGRNVDVTVSVHRGLLSRIFGGGGGGGLLGLFGGGAAGAAQAGGGAAGGVAGIPGGIGPALIGGGIAGLAALAPALLPLALGGLVGGGAAAGGIALGEKANKQLQALAKQLQSSSLKRGQRQDIRAQMAALRQQQAGPLAAFGGFQDLTGALKDTFSGAITSHGQGFSGAGPNASFVQGLAGILKQIAGFVKSIGPQLGDMFRASLPFLQAFVGFLEEAAKTLLPVFVQMLKEMAPFLPEIAKGFTALFQGLADMLKAIGPQGMQAAAKIFVGLMKAAGGILTVTGKALNFFAIAVQDVAHWLQQHWHVVEWLAAPVVTAVTLIIRHWAKFSHETAVIFDGVRHDIAHIWDMVWNNTIGRLMRGIRDFYHLGAQFRHSVANQFDSIRHDIAAIWDTIWRNTVTRAQHGISDVVGWFKSLPGRAIRALEGLGTMLYNFAHMAMTKLWNGLKSVFTSVWSWFKSLPGKLLSAIGIKSPPDWAIAAGKHIMGGILHGITSRKDELIARMQSISANAANAARFGITPQGPVQEYARRLLAAYGWGNQWAAFNNVVMRESGWNPFAQNPSSGAYGIPQALPGSKMASAGADWRTNPYTQLRWMMSYIAGRYGSPAGAWAHELSAGWYDRGGWLKPGLTLAYNATGRPEQVLPPGRSGGNNYTITVNVPPNANMRDIGRVTVQAIKQYEAGSGSGWRR